MNKPEVDRVLKRTISLTPLDDMYLEQLAIRWKMEKISHVIRKLIQDHKKMEWG